ncbi:hypothetical protein F4781DRAFT_435313 [Annulohypoxylon bovei var. microspora]|nr:hypothetical protein F4781DRAFT_435313 [Annulohypoxylon bovei var. microspora]
MSEPQADSRPAWAHIAFPPDWSSNRVQALTLSDFSQILEEERKLLWGTIRKFPFSAEYTKVQELNAALLKTKERPLTPPAGLDVNLAAKLSEEEHRLRAAGKTADDVRRAQKQSQLPTSAPSYIPAGWTIEQAICPSFELLSRLSNEDLTRFMQARNEANQSSSTANLAAQGVDAVPSPLVQTLQRVGFPPWGFVMVRTYYSSESRWEQFQEKLDAMCDEQLSGETGDGLEKIQETLGFKMIEDPRLQDVSAEEARRHFHLAKAMGGVAAGLDISVLVLGDARAVDSALTDGTNDSEAGEPGGYPGHFKVSIDSLLCELYPKLCMGLSPQSLWSMMDDAGGIWTGDDV